MDIQGSLSKLQSAPGSLVNYTLVLGAQHIALNSLIGQPIELKFLNKIECIACNRLIKKSYGQGYCYPCTQRLARCDLCILKPQLCHFHLNTCREPIWGERHCMIPHYVYLANTSGLKVGITRSTQVPTRWLDQGAVQAMPILKVKTRRLSGLIEVQLGQKFKDKTNWRKMLQQNIPKLDMAAAAQEALALIEPGINALRIEFGNSSITPLESLELYEFDYPIHSMPDSIKSLNLDKTPLITGKLLGIKGQYLILDQGVINIRKYTGYSVRFSA